MAETEFGSFWHLVDLSRLMSRVRRRVQCGRVVLAVRADSVTEWTE